MQFYTPSQIANILKIDILTVYNYIRKGKLEAVRLGRHYRISQEDFEQFLKASKARKYAQTS